MPFPCPKEIWPRMMSATSVLLTGHVRLDGDALGSELMLAPVLERHGKKVQIFNDSPIPRIYRFLPGIDRVRSDPAQIAPSFDLVVSLDTPSYDRAGRASRFFEKCDVINIDHHVSNQRFGVLQWIEPDAPCVAMLVHALLKTNGEPLTKETAVALYTAVITDTGRFTQSNATAESFRVAAEAVDAGAQPDEIARFLYRSYSPGQIQLQAIALNSLRLFAENRAAILCLDYDVFEKTGTRPIDTQGLIDILLSIDGVEVVVFLRTLDEQGTVKASLRSKTVADVNRIVKPFHGGGHTHAAGCQWHGVPLDEARRQIEKAVETELRRVGLL